MFNENDLNNNQLNPNTPDEQTEKNETNNLSNQTSEDTAPRTDAPAEGKQEEVRNTAPAPTSASESGEAPAPQTPTPRQEYQPRYTAPAEHVYSSYNQAPAPAPAPKKKKARKSGISAGAVAVLCVCSLLLSCASGFLGAHLATMNLSAEQITPTPPPAASSGDGASVIYQAADSPVKGMSSAGGNASYYNVASAVKDSVVEITTEFRVESYFQFVSTGAGSGVIITADGYIITNNHVIADSSSGNDLADAITVRLTNGDEYPATIIGTDADSDIAVIKIEPKQALSHAVIGNSDKLGVGEEVIAVGNPLGELGGTVTNGIISALNREIDVDGTKMNLLQTNTAINPGNSGGGLFNMNGELIGIVNAKSSGSDIEGLGFAIPVNEAVNVSEQLIKQGYVSGKPYLGVEFYSVTSMSQALYYGLPSLGIYVVGTEEGLNDTVFKSGDRVIAIDGKEIGSFSDISSTVKSHKPGDKIKFNIYRSGKLIEVEATCYEYVPEKGQLVEAESQPGGKN